MWNPLTDLTKKKNLFHIKAGSGNDLLQLSNMPDPWWTYSSKWSEVLAYKLPNTAYQITSLRLSCVCVNQPKVLHVAATELMVTWPVALSCCKHLYFFFSSSKFSKTVQQLNHDIFLTSLHQKSGSNCACCIVSTPYFNRHTTAPHAWICVYELTSYLFF
jgi:hypothetical protein